MEAKDTIIPIKERIKFGVWNGRERFAQVQAEISFKLGKQAGIKEGLNGLNKSLDKSKHPIFWKNCKTQRKRNAKICQDCPFRQAIIEQGAKNGGCL